MTFGSFVVKYLLCNVTRTTVKFRLKYKSNHVCYVQELVARNCLTFVETLWLCSREMKEPIGQQTSTDPSKKSDEPMETDQMVSSRNVCICV